MGCLNLICSICFLFITTTHGLPSAVSSESVDVAALRISDAMTRTEAALQGAKNFRTSYVAKTKPRLVPASQLKRFAKVAHKEAQKLTAQAGLFLSAMRNKDTYHHPPLNYQAKEWVNMISAKAEKQHTRSKKLNSLGVTGAKELLKEMAVSPTLITGFGLDAINLVLLTVTAAMPQTRGGRVSTVIDWIVLAVWWVAGVVVLMFDMGLNPITAIYALSEIPTTIGFGDYCPDTPALKMFQALHIWVSTAAVSGKMYELCGMALDAISSLVNTKKSAKVGFLITTVELMIEMTFSTFFYAWEFGSERGFFYDILDAFYMTVIAITTVGYGDFSPSTLYGQAASIPWQFFATETMSRFATSWEKYRSPRSNHTSRRSGGRRAMKVRAVKIKDPKTGDEQTIFTKLHTEDVAKQLTATTSEAPPVPGVLDRVRARVATGKGLTTTLIRTTTTYLEKEIPAETAATPADETAEIPADPEMSTNEANE